MKLVPTYSEALEITKNNHCFYESKFIIDGFNVSIFNYRYATYKDFVDFSAFELRGLTFVFDDSGKSYTFPQLEKFFNINENEFTLYNNIKSKKIKSVTLKEDGSIVSFIKLPNGRIVSKSKTSFESEQAKMAQLIFDSNSSINKMVTDWLDRGMVGVFELVSPKNKIVCDYESTKLILISLRSDDGVYQDIDDFVTDKVEKFHFNLDELIEMRKTKIGIEGWVVEFEDGFKIKIKTDWYLSLHRMFTEHSHREDYLIHMYLDDKIDDLISLHKKDSESRKFIEEVIERTKHKILVIESELDLMLSEYGGDRKVFSQKFLGHHLFGLSMKVISGYDKDLILIEYIKKLTSRLESARKWLSD